MLLDFSVAEDTKVRREAMALGQLGGNPVVHGSEHLRRFKAPTARSMRAAISIRWGHALRDAHAPAALSFAEWLLKEVLPQVCTERQAPPPRLRCWNKAVSPAVESMVRHCLEPDPANATNRPWSFAKTWTGSAAQPAPEVCPGTLCPGAHAQVGTAGIRVSLL